MLNVKSTAEGIVENQTYPNIFIIFSQSSTADTGLPVYIGTPNFVTISISKYSTKLSATVSLVTHCFSGRSTKFTNCFSGIKLVHFSLVLNSVNFSLVSNF
jgi:hypothetical protein